MRFGDHSGAGAAEMYRGESTPPARASAATAEEDASTALSACLAARSSAATPRGVSRSHATSQCRETHSPAEGASSIASPSSRQRTGRVVHAPSASRCPFHSSGRARLAARRPRPPRRGPASYGRDRARERLVDDARAQQPEPRVDGEDGSSGAARHRSRRRPEGDSRCARSARKRSSTWRASEPDETRSSNACSRPSTPRPREGRAGRRSHSSPRSVPGTASHPRMCGRGWRDRRRDAGAAVLEQRAGLVGAAESSAFGGRRSGRREAASWPRCGHRPARPPQRSQPDQRRACSDEDQADRIERCPSAAFAIRAVTTAPKTSTAVTSTACARASAAYQLAT